VSKPGNIIELLAAWKKEPPLEPQDQFPDIEDSPVK
jgi:antitoxin VapB